MTHQLCATGYDRTTDHMSILIKSTTFAIIAIDITDITNVVNGEVSRVLIEYQPNKNPPTSTDRRPCQRFLACFRWGSWVLVIFKYNKNPPTSTDRRTCHRFLAFMLRVLGFLLAFNKNKLLLLFYLKKQEPKNPQHKC